MGRKNKNLTLARGNVKKRESRSLGSAYQRGKKQDEVRLPNFKYRIRRKIESIYEY